MESPVYDTPKGPTLENSINRYLGTNQNWVLFLSAQLSEASFESLCLLEKNEETGKRETVPFLKR